MVVEGEEEASYRECVVVLIPSLNSSQAVLMHHQLKTLEACRNPKSWCPLTEVRLRWSDKEICGGVDASCKGAQL